MAQLNQALIKFWGNIRYKQARRGRPRPETPYRKITLRRYGIEWSLDEAAIAYDQKSDGMYPLLTNDRGLSAAEVLKAHKGQPAIEKRFEQLKTVHEIAPVFLKNRNYRDVVLLGGTGRTRDASKRCSRCTSWRSWCRR